MVPEKKSYSKINVFIRSSIFFIYSTVAIVLYGIFVSLLLIFPLRVRLVAITLFLKVYFIVLRVVCHIDYKIEGLENIPSNRNGIILCKHQSTWETYFIPPIFNIPAMIAKRELVWIPVFGTGLLASGPILINRNNKSSAMQQITQKGKAALDSGRWVMMFPEGTRVASGVVGNYKMGGARLAAATGYPILPIAHNAGRCWPRRQFIKHPGTVHVVIGPLIESEGKKPEELLVFAKDWIEHTMTRIDHA